MRARSKAVWRLVLKCMTGRLVFGQDLGRDDDLDLFREASVENPPRSSGEKDPRETDVGVEHDLDAHWPSRTAPMTFGISDRLSPAPRPVLRLNGNPRCRRRDRVGRGLSVQAVCWTAFTMTMLEGLGALVVEDLDFMLDLRPLLDRKSTV